MRINGIKNAVIVVAAVSPFFIGGCSTAVPNDSQPVVSTESSPVAAAPAVPVEPSSDFPDLQAPLKDERFRSSESPLATVDFRNFTYPMPRGWQNPDGTDVTLVDGKVAPVSEFVLEDMSDEDKAKARAERRIGLSHVVTKFFDVTGDGNDEAIVILKVETGGNAIPQIVYVYESKDGTPELIWYFRTGDRSDGGLKDVRPEGGQVVLELFGQDRFMLGEVETGKITGDEVQLCCPTHFTRTSYKWNGTHFIRQGDRLTFTTADPSAPPLINYGDIVNAKEKRGAK